MRHTVIGVFDTYAQAEDARSALITAGFARADIELQANPKRDDAAEPSVMPDVETHAEPGMLASIERFFSMLFGGRDQPPEVAHYSEAVRRGAVLVAVDTPSVEQADIARTTLSDQGAIDIDERAASWSALEHGGTPTPPIAAEEERDHSVLDELGLGRGSAVPGREPVNDPVADSSLNSPMTSPMRARSYPRADLGDPAQPVIDPLGDSRGDAMAPRDPAALGSRDYVSDPADDSLLGRPSATRDMEHATHDPLAGRDPLTGRDPRATTGVDPDPVGIDPLAGSLRDPLADPVLDPLAPRTALGASVSEADALAGRDPLRHTAETMSEREARERLDDGTLDPLPGVRTDMGADARAVNDPLNHPGNANLSDPLGPLDEPAKPYQASSGMQSQTPGMQSQSASAMGATPDPLRGQAGTQADGPIGPGGSAVMPNEYMEYEEDFRADYDAKYAATGEPYEDYQGAYRYGAMLGNDDRFRSRAWDDQMEYETQRDWESRHPEGSDTWERFKAAVRHGWDRVTGHHHV